ncbi:MAG: nodulation protein NfeD [Acidobacteria bacterium]|nr:nodulation protein NfeD [Acidobacteriota bacterium]
MAPGTRAGAAHPVMLAGTPDEILKKKIESDTAAGLRTLTDRRGRNTAMAQKAVLESQSFTEQEALREHLIELVASSDADLLGRLNGREVKRFDGRIVKLELGGVRVIDYIPTLRQDIQTALSDPNLALAFTLLGVLGIYLEFTSPGLILPGVAGAVLLVLGLSSLSVLPLNWTGVVLLVMAVALFILEAKIASHGILGGGGVVAMVLGSLLLVDSPVPEMRIRLSTALLLTLPFALISAFLVTLVVRARLRRPATGGETYAGSEAVTLTALSPEGKVLFRGDIWNARAEREIPANSQVRITSRRGLELMVE